MFDPALPATRRPRPSLAGELLLNADVEPDADGDVYGDETQDNCAGRRQPDQADRDHDGHGDACDATDAGPTRPAP